MQDRLPALLLPLALLSAFIAYLPGLTGTFQFDDLANLDALGHFGGVGDWQALWRFVLEGGSGPLGRPVSLFSFLLDDITWPPDSAAPFLRTNVLLHLLCGAVLCWLAFLLARVRGHIEQHAAWIALLAATLWLLHPFWVSTTLYIVQRMTILAALFTLAGLAMYLTARLHAARGATRGALALLVVSVPVFGGLAVLSKENGALLPVLILVLDVTVLRHLPVNDRGKPLWQLGHWLLVRLPALAVVGYLLWRLPGFIERAEIYRPFSLGERLLTQPRVLFDYLFQVLIPQAQTSGLFHDHFTLSRGLLEPPQTLLALTGLIILVAGAWWGRKRFPLLSMGILFFFAGHLMESTVVPLELYFEHRSYLPAAGLFVAAGFGLVQLARRHLPAGILAGTTAIALLTALTIARASLWGDPLQLSLVWAREAPDSARAQTQAALSLQRVGQPLKALRYVEEGLEYRPLSIELQLHRRILHCRLGIRDSGASRELRQALKTGNYSFTSFKGLRQHLDDTAAGRCGDSTTISDVIELVELTFANAIVRGSRAAQSNLHHLKGIAHLHDSDSLAGKSEFDEAMDLRPSVGLGLTQAAMLAGHGHPNAALAMLDRAETAMENDYPNLGSTAALTGMRSYHQDEIDRLRLVISTEASERPEQ